MLLLTLRGTPTLYYGDEIGMRQVTVRRIRCTIPSRRTCPVSASAANGCRTPMQWNAEPCGLFDGDAMAAAGPAIVRARTWSLSMPMSARSGVYRR